MPLQPQQWLAEFNPALRADGDQFDARVTQLKNGNVLVAWTTASQLGPGGPDGLDIIGRIFNPLGEAVSGEIRLNAEFATRDEQSVEIVALEDGGFLAVYHDQDTLNVPLLMDRFDALGNEVASMAGFGSASDASLDHAVAASSETSVMVAYHEAGEIKGQIYSPGEDFPTTGEFTIAKSNGGPITNVALTTLKSGNYAMTAVYTNSNGPTIVHKVMLPDGSTQSSLAFTGSTQLNGRTDIDPSITELEDGGFAIAWRSTDGGDRTILVQRHAANGNKVGEVIDVRDGSSAPFNGHDPQIASTQDGGFVVVFRSSVDNAIKARAFDEDGQAVGNFMTVADGSTARYPRVETLEDGRIAVTWTDVSPGNDVRVAIIDPREQGVAAYGPNPAAKEWYIGTQHADTAMTSDAKIINMYGGDDTIIFDENVISTPTFDGGRGHDTFKYNDTGISYFTAARFNSIEEVEFSDNPLHNGGVTFRSHQFGDGGLAVDLHVDGSGAGSSRLQVDMLNGGVFSLRNWTFERWQDGDDFVGVTGSSANDIVRGSDRNDRISLNSGDDRANGYDGDDTLTGANGNDTLNGSKGDDSIYGGLHDDRLNGGAGNDTLNGGSGDDAMKAGIGDDRVYGDTGADRIYAHHGNDIVEAGEGEDLVFGGNGDDIIDGGADQDTLRGGNQNDSINGGDGDDDIDGGTGKDTLTGGDGDDSIAGGDGNDELYGNEGDDTLKGDDNDDILNGGGGADRLVGGDGDDTLIGSSGADTLVGGNGDDVFAFDLANHSRPSRYDTISDFDSGADLIFLAGIDANTHLFGDQAFTFIGDDEFTGAGQVRTVEDNQGMRILARVDDDGSTDFRIDLDGIFASMSADDFIL